MGEGQDIPEIIFCEDISQPFSLHITRLLRYIVIVLKKIKLSEYVRFIMAEKNLSLSDVQKRSQGAISFGYVNDLLNEKSINPSVKKLQALALGLGVSENEIFRVARGLPIEMSDDPAPDEIVKKYQRLSPRRRYEALRMLDLLDDFDQGDSDENKDEAKRVPTKVSSSIPARSNRHKQIQEALDTAMGFSGEPMSEKDRETIQRELEKDAELPEDE